MKQLDLVTTASRDQIMQAWRQAFTRPGFLESLFSPSKKKARCCRWEAAAVDGEPVDAAVRLVSETDLVAEYVASKAGSNAGSVIAITIADITDGQRQVTVWSPTFKTFSVFQVNQFSGTFTIFAKMIRKKIKAVDPGARRVK